MTDISEKPSPSSPLWNLPHPQKFASSKKESVSIFPNPPKRKHRFFFYFLIIVACLALLIGTYLFIFSSDLLPLTRSLPSQTVFSPNSFVKGYIVADSYDQSGSKVAYYDIRFYNPDKAVSDIIAVPLSDIDTSSDVMTMSITDETNSAHPENVLVNLDESVVDPADIPKENALPSGKVCMTISSDGTPDVFACDTQKKLAIDTSSYDNSFSTTTATTTVKGYSISRKPLALLSLATTTASTSMQNVFVSKTVPHKVVHSSGSFVPKKVVFKYVPRQIVNDTPSPGPETFVESVISGTKNLFTNLTSSLKPITGTVSTVTYYSTSTIKRIATSTPSDQINVPTYVPQPTPLFIDTPQDSFTSTSNTSDNSGYFDPSSVPSAPPSFTADIVSDLVGSSNSVSYYVLRFYQGNSPASPFVAVSPSLVQSGGGKLSISLVDADGVHSDVTVPVSETPRNSSDVPSDPDYMYSGPLCYGYDSDSLNYVATTCDYNSSLFVGSSASLQAVPHKKIGQ